MLFRSVFLVLRMILLLLLNELGERNCRAMRGGLYTPPCIPCGVRGQSLDSPRTKFGLFLAEAEAKLENPSPSLVLGQS